MDIHIISRAEDLVTVFAFVGELPREVDVLHVLHSRAPVAVHLAAEAALVGPGPRLRVLTDVAPQHCRDVLEV